jgi:putative ABC transport system substrate-binding protein
MRAADCIMKSIEGQDAGAHSSASAQRSRLQIRKVRSDQRTRRAVEAGLVASLNRPGGNITGVVTLNVEVGPKRLELLHELIPAATDIGVLVNPTNATNAETVSKDLQAAARTLGLGLHVLHASAERDFDTVFVNLVQLRAGGLVIGTDPFFSSRSDQLAALALRYAVPTIYQYREFAAAGGLMSYGGSLSDAFRQKGVYTGRGPMLRAPRPHCGTCRERPAPPGCKSGSSTPLRSARSMRPLPPLRASAPMPSSSLATHSSPAAACNLPP